jgi:hypothetical protein
MTMYDDLVPRRLLAGGGHGVLHGIGLATNDNIPGQAFALPPDTL